MNGKRCNLTEESKQKSFIKKLLITISINVQVFSPIHPAAPILLTRCATVVCKEAFTMQSAEVALIFLKTTHIHTG